MSTSLHREITHNYFQTTACRGHVSSPEHYRQSAQLWGWRLRGWLPDGLDLRCLDLACGCGELLYFLQQRGYRNLAGVDLCRDELDAARVCVTAKLVHADVADFLRTAPDASFDFITALNFLEHLPKDLLFTVLTEVRRVLRPGGTLVAMVPNAISPFGSLTRHWDLTHEWAFTPNNFRQLAALVGFDPAVEFRECGPIAHGIVSGARVLLWKLIRLGIRAWFMVEVANPKDGIYTMDMLVRMRVPGLDSPGSPRAQNAENASATSCLARGADR